MQIGEIHMRLYFKQARRSIDRLFGRGMSHNKKEYEVVNENGQILYTVYIDVHRYTIYDSVGNNIATLTETFGGSNCTISGINGINGVFERMSLHANKGYKWLSAGYIFNMVDAGNFDVYKNGFHVMHITREITLKVIDDNSNYWLDLYNPECMLDGVIITMCKALLSYRRS